MAVGSIRQARYRQKRQQSGIVQINVQAPAEHKEALQALAARLRDGEPWPSEENAADLARERDRLVDELEHAQAAIDEAERRAADAEQRASEAERARDAALQDRDRFIGWIRAVYNARWLQPLIRRLVGRPPKPTV